AGPEPTAVQAPLRLAGPDGLSATEATLARAEITEALAYLAPRMGRLELDGEPVFEPVTGIYGMRSLPIRFGERSPSVR
ncbi:MAG: hypothetical protein ACRD0J_06970, partial [Acidimicrobiales bacterium]